MRLSIRHVTTYRYREPVALGPHRIMCRPLEGVDQRLVEARLAITPEPASLRWISDAFGNGVAVARFKGRTDELRVECAMEVDRQPWAAREIAADPRPYPFGYGADEKPDLASCIERRYPDPDGAVDGWIRGFLPADGPIGIGSLLAAVSRSVRSEFAYLRRTEKGVQHPATTLRLRQGTCRDFAVLVMEGMRALGLAARFVSGYLHVHEDGQRADSAADAAGRGGGSTHAWVQVYLPEAGWAELDPTNGTVGNDDLVRVAVARDPAQAIPLHGTWTGFPSDDLGMTVRVSVRASAADLGDGDDRRRGEMPKQAASR